MQIPNIKKYYTLKLAVLAGLIFVLFCGSVFLFLLPELEKEFINRKKETLRSATQVALSQIKHYQELSEDGELSEKDAQSRALKDIRGYRYGKDGKDYFWINDMSGTMMMHPYRSDLVGKKHHELMDKETQRILLDFVDIVKRNGSGFSSYLWQWQDDPNHVIEKISYIEGFDDWQWIIGTGFYQDDVKDDLARLIRHVLAVLIFTLSCIVLLLFMIVYKAVIANVAHQQATRLLVQSEKRFRELAEMLPEGIFECDLDLKVTYANSRAFEMLGYSQADLAEGFNCLQIFNEESRKQAEDIFYRKLAGEVTGSAEYIAIRKNGSTLPVLLHSSRVERDGKLVGLRGIIVDITRQKQIEDQLKDHRDNLERHVAERTRELEAALSEVSVLGGLIPICAKCKKIRDDQGYWNQVDTYIEQHTDANFSHSTCPDCVEILYGEEEWFKKGNGNK